MANQPAQTIFKRRYSNNQQVHEKVLNITNQGNVNKNHNENLIPVRMAIIKRQEKTSAGENVEKREHLYTVGRNVNRYSHYGKHYEGSSKK